MNSRKNKCLSISEKKRVIQAVEDGQLKKDVAKQFGILQSTLSMILKKKDCITGSTLTDTRKRSRPSKYPHLEECLLQWIRQSKCQNFPVRGTMLKEKAKFFAQLLGIQGFAASEGWLTNFKNRHGITFKKNYGGRKSMDTFICSPWIYKFNQLLNGYDPKHTFNTDEIGLFYKCLPDRTLTFNDKKYKGDKLNKDILTVLLACNMIESEKFKSLIGNSVKSHCFKGMIKVPCPQLLGQIKKLEMTMLIN